MTMRTTMVKFKEFLMKTHDISAIRYSRRNIVVLKQGPNVLATAYVARGKITDLTFEKHTNKWAALLRFHVALRNSPVRMYDPSVNHQNICSTPTCFKYLTEQFKDEWDRFLALERSDAAEADGSCVIASLNKFADAVETILAA